VLCSPGPVTTLVDLSLCPEHRRGHGAMYDGLSSGAVEIKGLAPTPGAPSNIGTLNDAEARRATRGSSWNRMPGDHGRGSTVRIGTRRAAPRSGRGVLGDDRGQHHGEHDAEIRAASGTPESTRNWSSAVCGCAFASFRSVSSTIWMGWSRSAWRRRVSSCFPAEELALRRIFERKCGEPFVGCRSGSERWRRWWRWW